MQLTPSDMQSVLNDTEKLIKATGVEVYQHDAVNNLVFQLQLKIVEDAMACYEDGGLICLAHYVGQIAKKSESM